MCCGITVGRVCCGVTGHSRPCVCCGVTVGHVCCGVARGLFYSQ